jgi:hypothetical protein
MSNPIDQTLLQFLEQFRIGTPLPYTEQQLENIGCEPGKESEMEVIIFELAQEFPKGKLTAFAVEYILRLGYRDVFTTQSINEDSESLSEVDELLHTSLVTGKNGDEDLMMISVRYGKTSAQFILTH